MTFQKYSTVLSKFKNNVRTPSYLKENKKKNTEKTKIILRRLDFY